LNINIYLSICIKNESWRVTTGTGGQPIPCFSVLIEMRKIKYVGRCFWVAWIDITSALDCIWPTRFYTCIQK
jgi:hypothetical protein